MGKNTEVQVSEAHILAVWHLRKAESRGVPGEEWRAGVLLPPTLSGYEQGEVGTQRAPTHPCLSLSLVS